MVRTIQQLFIVQVTSVSQIWQQHISAGRVLSHHQAAATNHTKKKTM